MPVPVYNPRIVGQGLARLTTAFINQPHIRNWLAACLQPFQDLEDMYWGQNPANFGSGMLVSRFLATATQYTLPETNVVFDVIGELVGQPRSGLSDFDYVSLIYLRVAVNRATGVPPNWSNFAAILLQTSAGPVSYYEGDQAASPFFVPGLFLGVWDMTLNPTIVAGILANAVPNGVYGVFASTIWPDGNDFEWADSQNLAVSGQGTFGDSVAGLVGGLLVDGKAI